MLTRSVQTATESQQRKPIRMLCCNRIIISVLNPVTSLGAEAGKRTLIPIKDPMESLLWVQLYSQTTGVAK